MTFRLSRLTAAIAFALSGGSALAATPVFINEIHYDNAGTDSGEAVEIAGPAGTDLTGWQLVRYNGANGQSYSTPAELSGLPASIPGAAGTTGFVVVTYPQDGLQNGAPDGIALVDGGGTVVQFLSYEGAMTATNGPATGLTSENIGVTEGSSTPVGWSLQLGGSGAVYENFTWAAAASSTFGAANNGQTFSGGGDDTTPPAFSGSNPADGATAVDPAIGSVTVDFDEPIVAGPQVELSSVLCNGTEMRDGSASVAGVRVTLPVATLSTGASCTVTLPAAAVEDTAGNASVAPVSFSFTVSDPRAACGDDATLISAIQGSGAASPLDGSIRTVEAVVVGDFQATDGSGLVGFFVQEEDGDQDGNPQTSEGLFVYRSIALPDVQVGDLVRVTGEVSEYYGLTELDATTGSVLKCASDAWVTPATPVLPVPGVPDGDLAAATAAIDAYFEPFEGMLVTFDQTLAVSEYFELERYGSIRLSQGGRIPTFTAVSEPSAAGYVNHQIELARRTLISDDGSSAQNNSLVNGVALPYPWDELAGLQGLSATNRFRGGDTIDGLTGVLDYSYSKWRVQPVRERYAYTFAPANPRPVAPPNVGGTLKVASFNVLNYFSTIDTTASSSSGNCGPSATLDCRGADSAAELARQSEKAATALCAMGADIVGLMEIENNASASLQSLVDAADSKGCTYAFVNTGTIGADAIKVGLLYNPATVELVGTHRILDSSVDPDFDDTKNRPALAQSFREKATGEVLTVAVNHLKSKGSVCDGDPDMGDGQGNCNLTRAAAAAALTDWLDADPTGSGDPDVLIVGDLNSYAKEDPIAAIEAAGYTNLVARFGGPSAYSYVFDGQTGYLDHALANADLAPQVTGTAEWHINADEPPAFDYNDTVKDVGEASYEVRPPVPQTPNLYVGDERRTSDHDPVLVGLALDGTPMAGDLDGNDQVDIDDLLILRSVLGDPASELPEADLDGDGRITVADGRQMVLLCANPRCAR